MREPVPEERAEDAEPQEALEPLPEPVDVHSKGISLLTILALFYTLYFARAFVLPMLLALLGYFLLAPLVRTLGRFKIAPPMGAFVVLIVLVGAVSWGLYTLSGPALSWMGKLPQTLQKLEQKLSNMQSPMQKVTRAAEQVEQLTEGEKKDGAQEVELKRPSLTESLRTGTQNVLFGAILVLILLYFLLASGDLFLRKLVKVLPRFEDKVNAVKIVREIELNVSRYLFTTGVINLGLGVAVALAMAALRMPNPVLWGVLVGVTNFVPYIGPIFSSGIIGLVALATFDDFGRAALAAGLSFGINGMEGYFVTPYILGKRLTLNPVVLFIGLTFWGWLWGIAGSLLAVPILATLKILCDHIAHLQAVGEFLGDDEAPASKA